MHKENGIDAYPKVLNKLFSENGQSIEPDLLDVGCMPNSTYSNVSQMNLPGQKCLDLVNHLHVLGAPCR